MTKHQPLEPRWYHMGIQCPIFILLSFSENFPQRAAYTLNASGPLVHLRQGSLPLLLLVKRKIRAQRKENVSIARLFSQC
jgi:hypothetical protein